MNNTTEPVNAGIKARLLEIRDEQIEVSYGCDCDPKDTMNHRYAVWLQEAIDRIAELERQLAEAGKDVLEDAANKFDGTTAYNWTSADGYSNAFDIASELRYMAAEAERKI